MLWNAIWLRQWGQALALLAMSLGGAYFVAVRFHPSPPWLIVHAITAAFLVRLSTIQNERYQGHLYDGGSNLPVAPLISLLCAVQLLYLTSAIQRESGRGARGAQADAQTTPTPIPTTQPSAAPPPQTGRYKEGALSIDYRDVPVSLAQTLATVLLNTGICSSRESSWAGLDDIVTGLRVTLVLPLGGTTTAELEAKYQLAADQLARSTVPSRVVILQVYDHHHRPLKSYRSKP